MYVGFLLIIAASRTASSLLASQGLRTCTPGYVENMPKSSIAWCVGPSGPVSIPTWLEATINGNFCIATPFLNWAADSNEVNTA